MHKTPLLTLAFGSLLTLVGCGSTDTPDPSGMAGSSVGTAGTPTGGAPQGGNAGGGTTSAGATSGGVANGGMASGGAASGGAAAGGGAGGSAPAGGTANGGASNGGTAGASIGGSGGAGGSSNNGGSSNGGAGGSGSGPIMSKGCSVKDGLKTLTTGGMSVANGLPTSTRLKIMSGGSSREFIIDIPADYDPTHPYRLVFSWHQAYGSNTGNAVGQYPAFQGPNFNATNYAFFGLHREATAAKQPTIFIAPAGIGNLPWDYKRDVVLFDDLLALVDANLCIDDSRVFSTGFSFGAMMSYALSVTRQSKLRGVVAMAPANWNFNMAGTQPTSAPIAFMGTTGMDDKTCNWIFNDANKEGGKYCALKHATDNGCKIPTEIQTVAKGSKKYLCVDFEGCNAGYPVKVCTFDGAHTPASVDDGNTTGDDGLKAFIPPLAWKFISQF